MNTSCIKNIEYDHAVQRIVVNTRRNGNLSFAKGNQARVLKVAVDPKIHKTLFINQGFHIEKGKLFGFGFFPDRGFCEEKMESAKIFLLQEISVLVPKKFGHKKYP